MLSCLAAAVLSACALFEEGIGESVPNVGPCPAAIALADTARLVEIGDEEIYSEVGYTGEILQVETWCRYTGEEPIGVRLEVDFALGRGPSAAGSRRSYEWYVAVTRRNSAVAAWKKLVFEAEFPEGVDIVRHRELLDTISIPRTSPTLSGSNFEIIVGFMLSPEQLAFNQSGKRFRIDAGG